MLTKEHENMIRLHTHTHTHTHKCYRQEIVAESFYANFVKNVNKYRYMNLVKGDEFL